MLIWKRTRSRTARTVREKRVKTPNGEVQIDTPRDRNGTFEPELLPKRQKSLGVDMDRQIIATYVRGASYDDIRDHLMDL